MLGVSYPTLVSWQRGDTMPDIKHLPTFENVLDHLIRKIDDYARSNGKWAREVADAIEGETPKWQNQAMPKNEHEHVVRLVKEHLKGGPLKYKDIERDAFEKGFTRSQVQYAGKRLRVIKEAVGKGRKAYSLWRLP